MPGVGAAPLQSALLAAQILHPWGQEYAGPLVLQNWLFLAKPPTAIVPRTAVATESASATSITVTLPADRQTGDLVICWVSVPGTSTGQLTAPGGGWTELFSPFTVADNNIVAAYWQFNPAAAPTITTSAAASRTSATCQAFGGVDGGTPFDAGPTTAATTPYGSSLTPADLTTVTVGAWLVSAAIVDSPSELFTGTPAGMTVVASTNGSTPTAGRGNSMAQQGPVPVGAQGAKTWSIGGTLGLGGFSVALRPASAIGRPAPVSPGLRANAAAAAPAPVVARSTASPVVLVDAPPRVVAGAVGGTRLAPVWAAVHRSVTVPVLVDDARPVPVVGVAAAVPRVAPVPVVDRSTADPVEVRTRVAGLVAPARPAAVAPPAVVARSTADPVEVRVPAVVCPVPPRAGMAAPTAVAARSTADPVAVLDALPRVVLAGALGMPAAAPAAFVARQVADPAQTDQRPGWNRPVPVLSLPLAAIPATVLLRCFGDPREVLARIVASGAPGTVPAAAPVPMVARSTADPVILVDAPPRVAGLVAPARPSPAAPPATVVVSQDVTPLQPSSTPAPPLIARIASLPKASAPAHLDRSTADPVPTATPRPPLFAATTATTTPAVAATVVQAAADTTPTQPPRLLTTATPATPVTVATTAPAPVLRRRPDDEPAALPHLAVIARAFAAAAAAPPPHLQRSVTTADTTRPRPPTGLAAAATRVLAAYAVLARAALDPVALAATIGQITSGRPTGPWHTSTDAPPGITSGTLQGAGHISGSDWAGTALTSGPRTGTPTITTGG